MRIEPIYLKLRQCWSWGLTVNLVCAIYLVIDLLVFQYSPYSGRISTLVCEGEQQDQVICTATIHGWFDQYQRTFLASDFSSVQITSDSKGYSASIMCGIMLETRLRYVKLVDHYQPCSKMTPFGEELRQLFAEERGPTFQITYVGWNFWNYFRILLLVGGSLIVWVKRDRLKNQPAPTDHNEISLPTIIHWLWINLGTKFLSYLAIYFIGGSWLLVFISYPNTMGAFLNACPKSLTIAWLCAGCTRFPIPQLIGLYPLLAISTLLALVQWRYLNQKISISRWWISAPALASLVFFFVINSETTCWDYLSLRNLSSGFIFNISTELAWTIILYAFILGFIQWLVLRKCVSSATGWIVIPLINTMIAPLAYYVLDKLKLWDYWFVLLLGCVLFAEVIQAAYVAWMVSKQEINRT